MPDPRVVVLGGSGCFGRLLVSDLANRVAATVIVVGRRRSRLEDLVREVGESRARLAVAAADMLAPGSLEGILRPGDVVVDCAGPFWRDAEVARRCVTRGCHFIDIGDARDYLCDMQSRRAAWASAGTCVLSGASTLPGLIVLLGKRAEQSLGPVRAISAWIVAGTRGARGDATLRALLASTSDPLNILRDGATRVVPAWTEPRLGRFPDPLGDRVGYLASDADAVILPAYFPALRDAAFRVGLEFGVANQAVRALAAVGHAWPPASRAALPVVRALAPFIGRFGTGAGGLLVEASSGEESGGGSVRISITGAHQAEAIAIIPASVAVQRILANTMKPAAGWIGLDCWISFDQIRAEFIERGFQVIERVAARAEALT
jgi:hypothetical protein